MAERKNTDQDETNGKDTDGASAVRESSQSQVDEVAIVSRTATGEAHQHPGYKVIGLPEGATEEQKAAAANRPAKKRKG